MKVFVIGKERELGLEAFLRPEWLKILVKDLGVAKDVTSDTQKYTAWDFAEWAEQHDMKVFLDELWLFNAIVET